MSREKKKLLVNDAGSDFEYVRTLAIDMDGTLNYFFSWKGPQYFGELFDGAKRFLERLHTKFRIVIHSCRCNEQLNQMPVEELKKFLEDFMKEHELPYDEIWTGKGKPVADFYIDDKGVWCNPEEDPEIYDKICQALGV